MNIEKRYRTEEVKDTKFSTDIPKHFIGNSVTARVIRCSSSSEHLLGAKIGRHYIDTRPIIEVCRLRQGKRVQYEDNKCLNVGNFHT